MATTATVKVKEFGTEVGFAVEQFLYNKRKQSEKTFLAYEADLTHFIETMFSKKVRTLTKEDLNSICYENLQEYFDNLYKLKDVNGEKKYKNTSINRKMSSIKKLLQYLKARNIIDVDLSFLSLIEQLPSDTESIETIPLEIGFQYAEAAYKYEKHKKNEKKMLIRMAIDTGLRLSELLMLDTNIHFVETGTENVVISGFGKGNKKFKVAIKEHFYQEIIDTLGHGKLFTLSVKNVTDMMNRLKKIMGHENRRYSFHSFRKTSLTFTHDLTKDIKEVQKKGHHSSVETSINYVADREIKVTGAISLGDSVANDLYKRVSHQQLIEALGELSASELLLINIILDSKSKKEKLKN